MDLEEEGKKWEEKAKRRLLELDQRCFLCIEKFLFVLAQGKNVYNKTVSHAFRGGAVEKRNETLIGCKR